MIGVFGTLLLPLGLPAVVKYLLLAALTITASSLVVSGYRSLVWNLKSSRSETASQTADPG